MTCPSAYPYAAVTLQFIGLLFNTAVHVVMYYYYFRRVLGWPVVWKRHVTKFQVVQFGTSFVCGLVTLALLLGGAQCAGMWPLAANFVFNMTLLQQFLGVLGKGKGGKGGATNGASGGELRNGRAPKAE